MGVVAILKLMSPLRLSKTYHDKSSKVNR